MDAVVAPFGVGSGRSGLPRIASHDFDRPDLVELKHNLDRVLGPRCGQVWGQLLVATRLTGDETDLDSLDRALSLLGSCPDRVAALVAPSMLVRVASFRSLAERQPAPSVPIAAPPVPSPEGAPTQMSAADSPVEPSTDPLTAGLPAPRAESDAAPRFSHLDALISYERLSEVAQYDLMDPALAEELDAIAHRTMTRLNQPASYVSIVLDSAQLIIGSSGIEGWIKVVGGTPVEWSFCSHTVAHGRPYLVEDAFNDPKHADSPLVRIEGTASYAGVPLTTPSGQVLGAHCVISSKPQQFTAEQVSVLESAAQEIMALLERYKVAIPETTWEHAWNETTWEPGEVV